MITTVTKLVHRRMGVAIDVVEGEALRMAVVDGCIEVSALIEPHGHRMTIWCAKLADGDTAEIVRIPITLHA